MAGAGAQTLFQSTHPSGVRLCKTYRNMQPRAFQSTHPSGVRLCRAQFKHRIRRISIHAPQWGATDAPYWFVVFKQFQSTHPSGVRLSGGKKLLGQNVFQSTHPSGVRPRNRGGGSVPACISIHAPQWGATREQCAVVLDQVISIHAPQWGATRFPPCPTRNPEYFNPRTPVGCDATPRALEPNAFLFQSTHPSGVRPRRRACATGRQDFNPRTPVGCDKAGRSGDGDTHVFQSTHPSGVRRCCPLASRHLTLFQSTHPSGVRLVIPEVG